MRPALLAFLLAALLMPPIAAAPAVRLPDLDNRLVDPFLAAEDHRALVFLFASVECPISNRYAPVVKRLVETFAAQGVAFWLIYPTPADSRAAIREHIKAFDYPVHALRDPRHGTKSAMKQPTAVADACFCGCPASASVSASARSLRVGDGRSTPMLT